MTKKKARYKVLKPVRNDKSGKYWPVGETVLEGDFPKSIIDGWLKAKPPVLEVDSGSDT